MSVSSVGFDKMVTERQGFRPEVSRPAPQKQATERVGALDGVERKAQLRELKERAQEQNLEVQLKPLPEANVVVIRFVNPSTGNVVREYPSEQIAKALAELRTKISEGQNCVNRCA